MASGVKIYERLRESVMGSDEVLNTDQAIVRAGGMGCYQLLAGVMISFSTQSLES